MSSKPIREHYGKQLLKSLNTCSLLLNVEDQDCFLKAETNEWILNSRLVVKPDMLMKRRGKAGLLGLDLDWIQVKQWISNLKSKTITMGEAKGEITHFIVEKFITHEMKDEHYVCIQSVVEGDLVYYSTRGGIDIGDVDSHAKKLIIKPMEEYRFDSLTQNKQIVNFIQKLYLIYVDMHFTYLEINPLVVKLNEIFILDLAAKLDSTAEFLCSSLWGKVEFPAPFGRKLTKEEEYVSELDAKTGASLKLTVLNPMGRIWTMVAGGGASVVYSDAIAALGYASELANYGEYSGAPSETQTYEYAKTILSLMTKQETKNKILFIGGGIANFTNVMLTFKGISRALREYQHLLNLQKIKIFVRRAGPNWQEGLQHIKQLSSEIQLDLQVFGPETHITAIVTMALTKLKTKALTTYDTDLSFVETWDTVDFSFTKEQTALILGMQPRAVQGMLDFDFICQRSSPSVQAIVYPFGGNFMQKFYWGTKETMIPVYQNITDAFKKHKMNTVVNFYSFRSAFESTMQILKDFPEVKCISIIAEGVPERQSKVLKTLSCKKQVLIIGPATVGGIKPGCFKIGNTGGMMDNIISSKLYRPGSVAYVSKSGGMSNELNNIISRNSDGVYEGIAIGGDRFPGSTFLDHMLRYEKDPNVKIMLMLGEVGGIEEYRVAKAIQMKKITKPVLAWCIGTCASMFSTNVQFGHAGAMANSQLEQADAKNFILRNYLFVPESFEELPNMLKSIFDSMVSKQEILVKPEPEPPKVPIDYNWAVELGLVRKPAEFVSSICDDRGQELLYAGMPISQVFKENIGIGGVVSLLWFKRLMPSYCCQFIEMVLMLTADHGPAVSGAHNTIVTSRAGKDLVSSICSGLLTIGDRFGGALDGAAEMFSQAYDKNMSPQDFVDHVRKTGKLILGIGHRVKSVTNPDFRVEILKEFAKKHFPSTLILDYALEVEKITTKKKESLILNVDGAIGCLFVDLLRCSGSFNREEADEILSIGTLNGLFVLGRSIGFIGHFLDQKRLKQGLYRHPWDDISYINDAEQRYLASIKK